MKKVFFFAVLILSTMLCGCAMQIPSVEGEYSSENEPGSREDVNRLLEGVREDADREAAKQKAQEAQRKLRQELMDAKQQDIVLRAELEAKRKAEEAKAQKARMEEERKAAEKKAAEEAKAQKARMEEERKAAEKKAAEEKAEEERKAELARQGITEGPLGILMGSFTTSFADSGSERKHNIQHAAAMINGTKLEPGEHFSTSATIGPITEENGYQTAGAYQDGKVIDSVGGGVCQISTTLYNAVLASELKVTERAEHSMTVSYVDVARDAAIAGDYKDFCFENSTDDTIHIEGWATDSELTFQIWGGDTKKKNGRTIKFETVILEEYEPGEPVVTEDDSKEADYYHEKQAAHTGYKAELYKVIYQDGVETDRVKINSSSYEASPAQIVVGPQ